jgi:Zn-dependent peptidase ImmA (M78 family)
VLEELAIRGTGVRLRPKTAEQARLARDLAESIGDLSKEGVAFLRQFLATARSAKHSFLDVRKRAMLASAVFNLDQKLTFDVLRVIENKIHLVDEDFFLKVESEESGQTTLHSSSNGKKVCNVTSSQWFYSEADRQTPLSRFQLAHEIAHWILHPEKNHAYSRLPTNYISTKRYLGIEIEADVFAREFLLPITVVDRFDSPEALAKAANVPVWVAQKRFRELRELTAHERYTLRLYAKSIRDICVRSKVEASFGQTLFGEPSKIDAATEIKQKSLSKCIRRRKTSANSPNLFDYADLKESGKTRSTEWFQKYGYRGD